MALSAPRGYALAARRVAQGAPAGRGAARFGFRIALLSPVSFRSRRRSTEASRAWWRCSPRG